MAGNRTKGIRIYNLLVKEVSAINRNLPVNRKLSRKELYSFVSKKIYPSYRGQSISRIRLKPLRDFIFHKIQWVPRKKGCNVLAIDPGTYSDIEYFVVAEFIWRVLPPCIMIKVNADGFGETNIFNTADYNYYASGIAQITNNINQYLNRNPFQRTSPGFRYNGMVQVLPGKSNNGHPDNYYLEMVLEGPTEVVVYEPEKEPKVVKIPRRKKTKYQKKQAKDVKQYVMDRLKEMKQQRSRIKRIRQQIEKDIHKFKERSMFLTADQKKQKLKSIYLKEKKRLTELFNDNVLSKKQYTSLSRRIKKGYGQK